MWYEPEKIQVTREKLKKNKDKITWSPIQDTDQSFLDKTFDKFEQKILGAKQAHPDATIRRRIILLTLISFVGATTLVIFAILALFQNAFLLCILDISFALAFIVNILHARVRRNYQVNIYAGITLATCLYIFLYTTGGVNQTAHVWYYTFPLMASFLLGSKKGSIATLVMTIPVITLIFLNTENSLIAEYRLEFEVRFLASYLVVALFSYFFEKAGEKNRQDILSINKNLEEIVKTRTLELTNLNIQLTEKVEHHKQAEKLLAQSEEKFRGLIDLAAIGILLGSHDGIIIEANRYICDIFGFERANFIGLHISKLPFTEESMQKSPLRFDLIQNGETVIRQRTIQHKNGNLITVEMRTIMMPDGTYQSIFTDITERDRVEQELRESEERFRLAFHTSPDAINLNRLDDGLYIDINHGFAKAMGYTREEIVGKSSVSLNIWKNIDDRNRLVEGLKEQGYVENLEAEFVSKNGEVIHGLMSASILHINREDIILSITRDITDRKRAEEEKAQVEATLIQAQKMEAMGSLAGGIAHDFNNLLMGIQGRVTMMEANFLESDLNLEHSDAIQEYIRSATNLTRQLLGAAKGGKYDPMPRDIVELVESSAAMFSRTTKEVDVHTSHSAVSIVADIDRAQLEQVLLNLYVNAWQAMPGGGSLFIETSIEILDAAQCEPYHIPPGDYVNITVRDTGSGIDESICHRIFDPFFTTKEKERGTGLGLASAYGIIHNHDGFITVSSEIGIGSTFFLYLPLSDKQPQKHKKLGSVITQGEETILFVDDEDMIIEVAQTMLQALGYKVITVNGGEQALDYFKDKHEDIDLVILDLIMPGVDGGWTFDRIREISPLIPVILSSGYAIDGQASEIIRRGCNGFIQKPFSLSDISQKIRDVIDKTQEQ